MATLFTPQRTFENLAVTGCLCLSGRVLPVDKLRPVLDAAFRERVTNVALPSDNLLSDGVGGDFRLVDVEAKAADIAAAPVTPGEANGTEAPRGLTRQVEVAVSSRIYDTVKFFAVSTVFDCMQLALAVDAKAAANGSNSGNGE